MLGSGYIIFCICINTYIYFHRITYIHIWLYIRYGMHATSTQQNRTCQSFKKRITSKSNIRPLFGLRAEKIQGGPLVGEKAKQIQGQGQIWTGFVRKGQTNTRSGFRAGVKALGPKTQIEDNSSLGWGISGTCIDRRRC